MNLKGHIDELTRFRVSGWAADLDDPAATIRLGLFVNGEGCLAIEADRFRPGLDQLVPGATGRYAFSCYFPARLSPYHRHEVTIRCAGTDFVLRAELPALQPIAVPPSDDAYRPHGPILLTSGGRSGSTAVMAVLARHPGILVAGQPPFEVEMGCYYAYALRTLVSAADHEHSLRPDRITDVRHQNHIGFNPYLEPFVFGAPEVLRRFLVGNLPGRVGAAFRDIILDYYQTVAQAQAKKYPVYFAEKTLPEPDSRHGVRYLFGNTKEIVLLRDPRDVICSFMKHGGVPFAEAVSNAVSTARQCLAIKAEQAENTHFLRYEDFVLRQPEMLDGLFRFVGLGPAEYDTGGMDRLFQSHGTSRTPADSIGRWQRDLSAEQLEKCRGFGAFLEEFGYEAARTGTDGSQGAHLDQRTI